MYKSKLQEYCQRNGQKLPEYSTTKEGFDHCPKFKASVIVNGTTYITPHFSNSSKDAHNLVATIAFQHLTGSSSAGPATFASDTLKQPGPSEAVQAPPLRIANPTSGEDKKPKGSSSAGPATFASDTLKQPGPSEAVQASPLRIANPNSGEDKKPKDMTHLYKNQLQIYAQKRNLNLPVYISEREGPPHAYRFKSKVMLEGKTYECQDYFSTLKDAENAAAKIALTSVFVGIEEEDPSVFKNLLQEMAQKDYSCLPEYNTTSSGPSHAPVFISTVDIKGESFIGQATKTKKLAEMYAAKVAYSALKERKSKQDSEHVSPGSHADGAPHSSSAMVQSIALAESPLRTGHVPNMGSSEAYVEHAICGKGAYQKTSESGHVMVQSEGIHDTDQNTSGLKTKDMPFSRSPSHSSGQAQSSSSLTENNNPWAIPSSLAAHKKVIVFRREQNMTIPPGARITHEDEKWVAVTMDLKAVHN